MNNHFLNSKVYVQIILLSKVALILIGLSLFSKAKISLYKAIVCESLKSTTVFKPNNMAKKIKHKNDSYTTLDKR